MPRIQLGDVIAERTYQWRTVRRTYEVTVCVGRPVPDPVPGGDWVCQVAFRGGPRGLVPSRVYAVHGVDAVQALVLALGYAQRELARVQRAGGGTLTWIDASDLGLPDILGLIGVARMFRAPPKARLTTRQVAAT